MKYIKDYEKFLESASPADLNETIFSISAFLSDFYSIVSIPAYDADMEGEVITVKALRGDDYFVSFETTPDRSISAITFGSAISPLNISASIHTAFTVR